MSRSTMSKLLVVASVAVDLALLMSVVLWFNDRNTTTTFFLFFCLAAAVFMMVVVVSWRRGSWTVKDHTRNW